MTKSKPKPSASVAPMPDTVWELAARIVKDLRAMQALLSHEVPYLSAKLNMEKKGHSLTIDYPDEYGERFQKLEFYVDLESLRFYRCDVGGAFPATVR